MPEAHAIAGSTAPVEESSTESMLTGIRQVGNSPKDVVSVSEVAKLWRTGGQAFDNP
jgi:hypothetical protein